MQEMKFVDDISPILQPKAERRVKLINNTRREAFRGYSGTGDWGACYGVECNCGALLHINDGGSVTCPTCRATVHLRLHPEITVWPKGC